MTRAMIQFALIVLLAIASMPVWPYSSGWSYWPASMLFVVLAVILAPLGGTMMTSAAAE